MLPILQIGPLALPAPALILLLGFWLGLEFAEKHAPRFAVRPEQLYNAALVGVVAGIIGARLGYAARAPAAFLESPLGLLALTPQMLDPVSGLAAGLLAALAALRIMRAALWPALDTAVSLFSVLAVAVGLANLASGGGFGAPANLPWAIELWGARRHPSQVYETLAALLIAAALWPTLPAARRALQRPGFRIWTFLALTAGGRLILETFRGDSIILWNIFRSAQIAAWLVLAVSLWAIGRRLTPLAQDATLPAGEKGHGA
jgi:prolipoprotein diacylglyceryltransferase